MVFAVSSNRRFTVLDDGTLSIFYECSLSFLFLPGSVLLILLDLLTNFSKLFELLSEIPCASRLEIILS